MYTSYDELKQSTFGIRGSFSSREIEGLMSFLAHMRRAGHHYQLHSINRGSIEAFAQEGFIAIHTEPPKLGILYVKVENGRWLLGKKYSFHMYLAKDSDMTTLKKHFEYPKFFKSFKHISLLREGMKI